MTERVWLVHGNAEWYGSDRSLVLLARTLHAQGWDVTVSVPATGVLEEMLTSSGIRTIRFDPSPFRPRVFTKRELVRFVALDLPRSIWRTRVLAGEVDLVHLNTSNLLGSLVGARLAGRPTVLHVRESYAGYERQWRLYCRVAKLFTTRVIAISRDIAAELAVAGFGDRTVVIHNGLEFGDPPIPWTDTGSTRPVVTVGRINDWKGHDVLIAAIAVLRERGLVIPLEIAGDAFPGDEHRVDELVRLAEHLGVASQVRLLGYVDDVDGLLDRSALFVLPSVKPEPFGLALVDAMSRGVPCVATNAGGPRDIIEHGRTGLLVPPRDSAALADAIEQLWTDHSLRERLGRAGAESVRARFSIETTGRRVSALYREILDG